MFQGVVSGGICCFMPILCWKTSGKISNEFEPGEQTTIFWDDFHCGVILLQIP